MVPALRLWQDWSHEEGIVISEEPQNLSCVLAQNWTEYFHPSVCSTERFGQRPICPTREC